MDIACNYCWREPFGIIGMVVGMPLVSVIYELFGQYVNKKIETQNK